MDIVQTVAVIALATAVVVGVVVRGVRARRRGGSAAEGARIALDGADRVQDVVLARPDTGPVRYGGNGPQVELTVDHRDPLDDAAPGGRATP
ncbi:hypothetical protein [Cellulomonas iranensis]|uniref:hypothetical protein n=1 Tax=Cellulomonas iranensis TaxID=76862 RepID=UPI000B3D3AAE|nr:hypothetical protein [Cellulomonas iranensis]